MGEIVQLGRDHGLLYEYHRSSMAWAGESCLMHGCPQAATSGVRDECCGE